VPALAAQPRRSGITNDSGRTTVRLDREQAAVDLHVVDHQTAFVGLNN
jgi:hypothetical protein